jgi:hypothetical protein
MFRPMFAAVALVILAPGALAQNRPNFSGQWIAAGEQTEHLSISQDASTLTVKFRGPTREETVTYQLDGRESHNETITVRGEPWTHVSQARWVSNALVIITTTTPQAGGKGWEWMRVYSFPQSAGVLSVTTVDATLHPPMSMHTETRLYKPR